jgi:hemerythrin
VDNAFIQWEERYAVGIAIIDEQHKQLFGLTNALYEFCREGEISARENFKAVLRTAVDYINFHFTMEERIMERVNYPESAEHKRDHLRFVKKVLEESKLFEEGKSFVPHAFVRFLRDWILTHIAVSDKLVVDYILRIKRTGDLTVSLDRDELIF